MPIVKHFGMFEFKQGVSSEQIDGCFEAMRGMLGEVPGLLDFSSGPYDSSEGLSDGYTHGFIMSFASPAERDAYLPHPAHERVKEIVLPCLERVVVFDFNV